jgi:hypothetical protein
MDRTDEQRSEDRAAEAELKAAQARRTADDSTSAEERRRDAYRLR